MKLPTTLPRWVIILIAVCCVIEAALTIAPIVGFGAARSIALVYGGFWSVALWYGQGVYPGQPVVMFFTYGLLHGGLFHLAMNMLSLAAITQELSRLTTSVRIALIYLVSQIAAAGLFALLAPTGGPMVGASGAIFGLAGALIALAGKWRLRQSLSLRPILRAVLMIGGLNIALTFFVPSIAWQAHLGGLLAGFLMGLVLSPVHIAAMRVSQR